MVEVIIALDIGSLIVGSLQSKLCEHEFLKQVWKSHFTCHFLSLDVIDSSTLPDVEYFIDIVRQNEADDCCTDVTLLH